MRFLIYEVFLGEVIVLCWILFLLNRTRKMEERNNQLRSSMLCIEELFIIQKQRIDAMRKYRHDLANHIRTLEYMKKNPDGIIPAIFAIKRQQCEKYSIQWITDIQMESMELFLDYDIAGLFNNLLDNAIEANERIDELEKRWISLSLRKEKEYLILEIENPVNTGERITFETKKAKKEEHGLGRMIIGEIVRKYDGIDEIYHNKEENLMLEIIRFPMKNDWDGKS